MSVHKRRKPLRSQKFINRTFKRPQVTKPRHQGFAAAHRRREAKVLRAARA